MERLVSQPDAQRLHPSLDSLNGYPIEWDEHGLPLSVAVLGESKYATSLETPTNDITDQYISSSPHDLSSSTELDDSDQDAHWDFEDIELRSNRALNRGNRGAVDHDIMEGLPVRQWRKQNVVVNTQPPKEDAPANTDPNNRWRELPMPRGSEMYSPWSQALLRAARRPRVPQRNSKGLDEDKDMVEEEKPAPEPDAGIETIKWAQLSREQEQPEIEFLAKRRKGLPSLHEDPSAAQPMRKVKVKKVDADGNVAVFDVLRPEGTTVDGEIVENEHLPTEAPAPGTVVEGVGIANEQGVVVASEPAAATPHRRGPPRFKRKAKGPGRGRKKKQMLSPGVAAMAAANAAVRAPSGVGTNDETLKVPGVSTDVASGTDVDMGEESAAKDGEEGSDDDDEDGDERDEGDASDPEAVTRSVSPMRPSVEPETAPAVASTAQEGTGQVEPRGLSTDVPTSQNAQLEPTRQVGEDVIADAAATTAKANEVSTDDNMESGLQQAPSAAQSAEEKPANASIAPSTIPEINLPDAPPPSPPAVEPSAEQAPPALEVLLNPSDQEPASSAVTAPAQVPVATADEGLTDQTSLALPAPLSKGDDDPAAAADVSAEAPSATPVTMDDASAGTDTAASAGTLPPPQPLEPSIPDASAATEASTLPTIPPTDPGLDGAAQARVEDQPMEGT